MKPITPLHFPTEYVGIDTDEAVEYGQSRYRSDCGRFSIQKTRQGWEVIAHYMYLDHPTLSTMAWVAWLDHVGLSGAHFDTRTIAVKTLWEFLTTDSIAIAIDDADINQTHLPYSITFTPYPGDTWPNGTWSFDEHVIVVQ